MRIRQNPDGSIWIPRRNVELEKELDLKYEKIAERMWIPRIPERESYTTLFPILEGQTINIVGKGPSLDNLKCEHLENYITFAINESIHPIEALDCTTTVIAISQDYNLKSDCLPKKSILLINQRIKNWYPDYPRTYYFNFQNMITAAVAVQIATEAKVGKIRMLCFDAAMNKNTEYAKIIGRSPKSGGQPSRFLGHRSVVESISGHPPLDWLPLP
jgi:hypothetical protein